MLNTWLTAAAVAVATMAANAEAFDRQPQTLGGEPPILSGHPTNIHDGDTFRFGRTRIRIAGIDAPELQTRYGEAARQALVAAVGNDRIVCSDTGARSYGRVVARCATARGDDLAAIMAQTGWAVDWWSFSCGAYLAAERDAERAHRGVFADGMQPWRERPPHGRHCGAHRDGS